MPSILIIDDDEQVNSLLKMALEDDYDVDSAFNGKEAKSLYQKKKYDVIVTDIIMHDVDGYEVILDLRRMGLSDRTIAISGGGRTSADDYLLTARHFDVAASFSKPIDMEAFTAKIQEIIKNHQEGNP